MASVKLKLREDKVLAGGAHPVIIQILKDGKKSIVTVGARCHKKDWSTKLNLPKKQKTVNYMSKEVA
jgi:hypothetical protein